ncbi:hypothetical protein NDS46_30845 (plasmid) [Paenibacillus thiaminolyticus]|uniref:hypothetical protein n=1 Tax=Paenibacillus thiaminolyticus TaxID=49283 RepID=UPI00232F24F4|nr:hypothetical protein [Paenibacillus thiaminolyticus]WCF11745.1 hypothetical protein NDS46_30845 [Paenibacillus thiaminolyticus]
MKSKVMRLSYEEQAILSIFRDSISKEKLLNEMLAVNQSGKEYCPTIKKLLYILKREPYSDLEYLIETGFIDQEKANVLKKAIEENKNILIVGNLGVGKTVLLQALMSFQLEMYPHIKTAVLDQQKELKLCPKDEAVIFEKGNSLSMATIANLLQHPNEKKLILGEVITSSDTMASQIALDNGCSLLMTTSYRPEKYSEIIKNYKCFIVKINRHLDRSFVESIIETKG